MPPSGLIGSDGSSGGGYLGERRYLGHSCIAKKRSLLRRTSFGAWCPARPMSLPVSLGDDGIACSVMCLQLLPERGASTIYANSSRENPYGPAVE